MYSRRVPRFDDRQRNSRGIPKVVAVSTYIGESRWRFFSVLNSAHKQEQRISCTHRTTNPQRLIQRFLLIYKKPLFEFCCGTKFSWNLTIIWCIWDLQFRSTTNGAHKKNFFGELKYEISISVFIGNWELSIRNHNLFFDVIFEILTLDLSWFSISKLIFFRRS